MAEVHGLQATCALPEVESEIEEIFCILDDPENRKFFTLPGLELRPLGCPACSQLPYQLRYPSSSAIINNTSINVNSFSSYQSERNMIRINPVHV
jgi:hypothetical protein